ncbi:DUF2231 domain-containing protein [Spirosoma montaniterrae]|uniref:DUF2231 domain-containing protein n=1 Tax=Spirosoma montaniterrae TaxID=1178516 RepID=A0A1P9X4Q3_9BACT|nr:DUF2231 domain-containing protein [Spirosoma montaniterrae]AQG82563.1 hypothetical protein AWR27_17935 [Spirosoma montaniterrae]
MESQAKLAGHAAHPILIVFPLGLLSTSVLFDVVYLLTNNPTFAQVSYWMIVAGLLGGLVATLPGWVDWFAIPSRTRAKRIGLAHGMGNVLVLILFAISWLFRRDEISYAPSVIALVVSFVAFALVGFTGWLGGELVNRLGVGVDDGAHLNAPNSLSGRPATDIDGEGGRITDTEEHSRFA